MHGAFLAITEAYDNANREALWDIFEEEGLGNDYIELLREIYLENTVCFEWEGMRSEKKVDITKGVTQGCPLSPLLFMMYMVKMERALEGINIGFYLSYKQAGTIAEQQLQGLFDADNIVLLANRQSYMQRLANICGEEKNVIGFYVPTPLFDCEARRSGGLRNHLVHLGFFNVHLNLSTPVFSHFASIEMR